MGCEILSTSYNDFCPRMVDELENSIQVKAQVITEQISTLNGMAQLLIQALQEGKKIVLFGKPRAADCQHIAGELVGQFKRHRKALPALALNTDTSILTSIANDFGFADVFSRQIEALGHEGDVAIGISTSGNSANALKGIEKAKEEGMITVGFTGADGGELARCADICFRAPSQSTPRVQEVHITVAHVICELIDRELCEHNA